MLHRQMVTQRFGDNYQLLRELCRGRGWLLFNVKPKVHKMQHVPVLAEVMNHRCVHNYAEESFFGTCTRIWAKSVSGFRQVQADCPKSDSGQAVGGTVVAL